MPSPRRPFRLKPALRSRDLDLGPQPGSGQLLVQHRFRDDEPQDGALETGRSEHLRQLQQRAALAGSGELQPADQRGTTRPDPAAEERRHADQAVAGADQEQQPILGGGEGRVPTQHPLRGAERIGRALLGLEQLVPRRTVRSRELSRTDGFDQEVAGLLRRRCCRTSKHALRCHENHGYGPRHFG